MANFKVYGADRESGAELAQVISATSAEEAAQIARERGLTVSHVEPEFDLDSDAQLAEPDTASDTEPEARPEDEPTPPRPPEPADDAALSMAPELDQPGEPPHDRPDVSEPGLADSDTTEKADVVDEAADTGEAYAAIGAAAASREEDQREAHPEAERIEREDPSEAPEPTDASDAASVSADAHASPEPIPPAPAPPGEPSPPAPPRDLTGPGDRWGTAWLAYLRISVGLLWLFELLLGGRWGLAGPTADQGTGAPGWLARRSELAPGAIEQEAAPWIGWLYQNTFAPHAALWGGLWTAIEALIVVSLLLGLLVRPIALLALVYSFVFIGLGDTTLGLMFAVAHLVMLATGGGRVVSADQRLLQRFTGATGRPARAFAGLIELAILPRAAALVLAGLALLAALYHVLAMVHVELEAIRVVYLDLAVLLTLAALTLLVAARAFHAGGSIGDVVRLFVGYKLLDEILVRPGAGIDALPGWAGSETIASTLESLRDHHWQPVAEMLERFVLPGVDYWTAGFVVIQTLAGVLLLLGWRNRLAATLAALMMLVLVVFGFVGLAPFVLVYLIYVLAVGGGRMLAIDATLLPPSQRAKPAPWPRWLAAIVGLLAIALLILASYLGVAPSEPIEHVTAYAAIALAIPLIALTLIAWFEPRRPADVR